MGVVGESRFMGYFSAPQPGNMTHIVLIVCSGTTKPQLLSFFVTRASVDRAQNRGRGFVCFSWSYFQTQLSFFWATLSGDRTSAFRRMERGVYCDRVCDILHASSSKSPSKGTWSLDSIVLAPAVAPNAAIRGKLGIVREQTAGKSQNLEEGAGKGKLKAAGPWARSESTGLDGASLH